MKILLVADRDALKQFLEKEFSLRGADIVHYWHPIKAMDNVDEMAPDLVIFSARDFPRHWKPFLVYLRAYSPLMKKVPFILLSGENFDGEEAKKAEYLEVSAVIPEALDKPGDLQLLKKHIAPAKNSSYRPSKGETADILFTHPENLVLVQGHIEEISSASLSFSPKAPELCEDFSIPSVVHECSLNIFGILIGADIEITRKDAACLHARLLSGHDEIASHL
jgi:DNA-binding response OmpR family regulator